MIEAGGPVRGRMAGLASLRESGLHVIGIGCALEVLQVARHARSIGDAVVVVHMAGRARHAGVRTRQREASIAVIKRGA